MAKVADKNAMCLIVKAFALALALFVLVSPFSSALKPILEIDLGIKKSGGLLFDNTKVTFGLKSSVAAEQGDYTIMVTNVNGRPLFVNTFELNFLVYSDPVSESSYALLNEKIGYTKEMYKLELFRKNRLIYSRFLEFCNNDGQCGPNENYISCREDCSMGSDKLCISEVDGECDTDCLKGMDPDCEEKSYVWVWIFAIGLILAIAASGFYWRKKLYNLLEAIERFKYFKT